MFNLAQEWGIVTTRLPRVRLNPGENSRMRVLSPEEEEAYLRAATESGCEREKAYQSALNGIRATVRGEQPIKPDAYLLLHVAAVLLECGLRPDECHRLTCGQISDDSIVINQGKGKGSKRRVPCTPRVTVILEMRRTEASSHWVFPSATATGHIEASTLKKQHQAAIKAAGVTPFVVYDFRHTRITPWAKSLPLPVVQRLAGHTDIATTMRYVHVSDEDVRAAMARASEQERKWWSYFWAYHLEAASETPVKVTSKN